MNQQAQQRAFDWAPIIIACGAFALALSGYAIIDLIISMRASSDGDANGMLRFFLFITVPLFAASCRVLVRRKWAAIVVISFGWFAIYDWLSGPNTLGRFDWIMGLVIGVTLILTVALLRGEKAWKRSF